MRMRCAGIVGLAATLGVGAFLIVASSGTAFADSQPYELVCPGTPVGTVIINGVVTTATITPANPTTGQQFNVTNYQTNLTLIAKIAEAAVAIQPAIQGSANSTIDATGATPASIAAPQVTINTTIANGGTSGVPLSLPATPTSIGPFTASGGSITVTQDKTSKLTLILGGSPINTTCTSYPNNSNTTGLATATATLSGTPASPIIASTSASSGGTTPTTAATTATTAATTATTTAPATSAATGSSLPTTGPGPGITLLAMLGSILVVGAAMLLVYGPGRRSVLSLLYRMLRRGHYG